MKLGILYSVWRRDEELLQLAAEKRGFEVERLDEISLTLTLAAYCDSVAMRIESGLPWDLEPRLDRVKARSNRLAGVYAKERRP